MRFKVGDKVRVLESLTLEDVGRVHDMFEFRGLEATVETVFDQAYHLTVDNHEWYWMDELLEPVEEELEMSNVKSDIPEWVNWLARDENGSLYGYRNKPRRPIGSWSIGTVCADTNTWFVGNNPNHYPQVKWSDKEPHFYRNGGTFYNVDVDALVDAYEKLELSEEELEMSDVKFDMPEWVNWLARDRNGALFGYREKPMKCSTVFGASEAYTAGKPNLRFITSDPNHYPQVKWEDEEPKAYKDGITLLNPDELDEIHFYPSEEVSSGKSELDTNEAIIALRNFGRYFNERMNEPIETGGTPMKKYERHSEITKQLNEIYIAKNTDYGDAFGDTFKKLGIISAVTRIVDKTNRLMSLSAKTEAERNVKDETIKDTLMDLANYALMTLIEMEESE